MRYQYKCSLNNPACLAQEAQSGVWKWHYMAASRSGCLSVAAAARATDSSVRSVLCCSSSRCNMPDRNRDPATQIVLDSWLSRSTVRPTRTSAVAAAAPQASTLPAATDVTPAAVPRALPAPAPPRTVTPLMAAVVPDDVTAGDDGLQQLRTCFYGPVPRSDTVITQGLQAGMDVCARYQYQCIQGDTSCTATEVKNRVWKWMYMPTSKTNCEYLKAQPTVRHAVCCSSNNCNTVDPNLDPRSKPVVIAAGSSGSSGSRPPQTAAKFDGRNLDKSISSSSSSDQAIPTSSPPTGSGSSGGTITCYITYPWAPGQDVPQSPAVYSAEFSKKDGYETCARFSYRCSAAAGTCTPAEVKQGVWKSSYSALSRATCASIRSGSGMYRDVTCCDAVNCNKPDPGTKVLQAPVLTAA
eukprot:GHUV01011808.1.p1 GENE.GHUV01011808.1~~GHUV01011808.1.p1  ORF type:complete len:411 (+),score=119.58 GHUV01011808.1:613-1845(+)